MLGTGPLLGQALQHPWDRPALGSCLLQFLGQARSWERPFKIGTCPLKSLGQARSWDMPFKMLGTGPLVGHAFLHAWDKPAFGTGPSEFLGQGRSWGMPFKMLGTGPPLVQAFQYRFNIWIPEILNQRWAGPGPKGYRGPWHKHGLLRTRSPQKHGLLRKGHRKSAARGVPTKARRRGGCNQWGEVCPTVHA